MTTMIKTTTPTNPATPDYFYEHDDDDDDNYLLSPAVDLTCNVAFVAERLRRYVQVVVNFVGVGSSPTECIFFCFGQAQRFLVL